MAIAVKFPAQAGDIDVQNICPGIEVEPPHILQQHVPGHGFTARGHKIGKKVELLRAERNVLPRQMHSSPERAYFQRTDPYQIAFSRVGGSAPQDRCDPCTQFHAVERLCDVVVCSRLKTLDTVLQTTERGNEYEGRASVFGPQAFQKGQTVAVRQAAIADHQINVLNTLFQRIGKVA